MATAVSFSTQYDKHLRVYAEPGSGVKEIFSPYYTEEGILELEVTGKENLYEYIQSHKDSVDIHVILQRFVDSGDPSVLQRVQGFSFDATDMPKTYAEALNAMISAENYFNSLPVETRAQFGHSFQQFLASMDKPGFVSKLGFVADIVPQDPNPNPNPNSVSSPAAAPNPTTSQLAATQQASPANPTTISP